MSDSAVHSLDSLILFSKGSTEGGVGDFRMVLKSKSFDDVESSKVK